MNESSTAMLDLSDREELRWLAQVLADMRSAAPSAEPLLVGALARDLLLHYGHGIPVTRATSDVDLALAVEDWHEFAAVRDALLAGGCFSPTKGVVHRLRHHQYGLLDLLPFGAIERTDATIAWPPDGDEVMGMLGYREANASAIRVVLPQRQPLRLVSLPMLAVLKLLAWQDRHLLAPRKDATDLMLILDSYLDAGNADRLYAEMAHLLTDSFDFERTGAWLAGKDARTALQHHSSRAEWVIRSMAEVLSRELAADSSLTLIMQMNVRNPEAAHRLLAAFHSGLTGAEYP